MKFKSTYKIFYPTYRKDFSVIFFLNYNEFNDCYMSIDFRHHISLTPSRTELGKMGQSVRKQMGKKNKPNFFYTEKELTFYSKYIGGRRQYIYK